MKPILYGRVTCRPAVDALCIVLHTKTEDFLEFLAVTNYFMQHGCNTNETSRSPNVFPDRLVPLTTKSASFGPHREQASLTAQSVTVIIAPWCVTGSATVGPDLMLAALAPDNQPHLAGERSAERGRSPLALVALASHIGIMTTELSPPTRRRS